MQKTLITKETAKENQRKSAATRQVNRGKMHASVKESVALVFEKMGGVNGYFKWATNNPDKFYDHYLKILPVEMKAEVNVVTDFSNILEAARLRALDLPATTYTVTQEIDQIEDDPTER